MCEKILTQDKCFEIIAKIKFEQPVFWKKLCLYRSEDWQGKLAKVNSDQFDQVYEEQISIIKEYLPDILNHISYNIYSKQISSFSLICSMMNDAALSDWIEKYSND